MRSWIDHASHRRYRTEDGCQGFRSIPLPTERNLYCVIKRPHVSKDSREQFEMRTHKRLSISSMGPSTVDSLMRLDLPAGVDIEIEAA